MQRHTKLLFMKRDIHVSKVSKDENQLLSSTNSDQAKGPSFGVPKQNFLVALKIGETGNKDSKI